MARYGYMLLDARDPDVSRQALQLDSIGGFSRVFVDRSAAAAGTGGKRSQRKKLACLLRGGDVVYVASLDRWCDNLRDFLDTWEAFSQAGADLFIMAESLDTRSQAGRQAVRILREFWGLEFHYQSGRKKAGIESARLQGRRIGRPQVSIPPGFRDLCREWSEGKISGPEAARRSGLRNTSFYKKAAELGFKARHPATGERRRKAGGNGPEA